MSAAALLTAPWAGLTPDQQELALYRVRDEAGAHALALANARDLEERGPRPPRWLRALERTDPRYQAWTAELREVRS